MPLHLWLCKCFSLVGATCGRPRAFTERPYGVSVRICPQICFCGESISKNAFRRFESGYRPEIHLQNFEKLQSRKIASRCLDILRREKFLAGSRVFAFGEDSRALRLVSKLPDLRAANADLHSAPQAQNRANPVLPQPQQKPPDWVAFVVCHDYDLDA